MRWLFICYDDVGMWLYIFNANRLLNLIEHGAPACSIHVECLVCLILSCLLIPAVTWRRTWSLFSKGKVAKISSFSMISELKFLITMLFSHLNESTSSFKFQAQSEFHKVDNRSAVSPSNIFILWNGFSLSTISLSLSLSLSLILILNQTHPNFIDVVWLASMQEVLPFQPVSLSDSESVRFILSITISLLAI